MVNFLLLIEDISSYTKKHIDNGLTPPDVYKLCSCIRETFCLSYSIRKENDLFLFFINKLILIRFQGNKLRFLGSDERSQALLLIKAIKKFSQVEDKYKWMPSTPGILVRKFRDFHQFLYFIQFFFQDHKIFMINHFQHDGLLDLNEIRSIMDLNNYLFILHNFQDEEKESEIINSMKIINSLRYLSLPKTKKLEDKILYLNYLIENKEII